MNSFLVFSSFFFIILLDFAKDTEIFPRCSVFVVVFDYVLLFMIFCCCFGYCVFACDILQCFSTSVLFVFDTHSTGPGMGTGMGTGLGTMGLNIMLCTVHTTPRLGMEMGQGSDRLHTHFYHQVWYWERELQWVLYYANCFVDMFCCF